MRGRSVRLESMSGSRGRILEVLRRTPATARDLASRLDLSYSAVRMHLASLERAGLIHPAGLRRGETRPSVLYELAPSIEAAYSSAYIPFASQLVRALGDRLPEAELDGLMREVGRRLAFGLPRPSGELSERIQSAAALLDEFGAPNEVGRHNGTFVIRGFGCPLAAAVRQRPETCRALETLLQELLGAPVRERCERGPRPRCCFQVSAQT